MPVNRTLGALIADLRMELGQSPEVAHGIGNREQLRYRIQEAQRTVYREFDWPELRVFRDIEISAGQRYYDFPNDMDWQRISQVNTKYGTAWLTLQRGILPEHYQGLDSDLDQRLTPASRWDIRNTGSAVQIELWPMPAQDEQTLRLVGYKTLETLVEDSDVCSLDSDLIIPLAAYTVERDAPQKQVHLQKYTANLDRLKALSQASGRSTPFYIGGNPYGPSRPRQGPIADYLDNFPMPPQS